MDKYIGFDIDCKKKVINIVVVGNGIVVEGRFLGL